MAASPFSDGKIRLVFLIWWLLWAALQAYSLRSFSWEVALIDSIVTDLLLGAVCVIISNTLRYYGPKKNQYLYLVVWCLVLAGIWWYLSYEILSNTFAQHTAYIHSLQESFPVRFGITFLAIGWMAMISILWYTRQEQKAQDQRQTDAERLAREAELYKLRQQLQPHFLFNSLNSISALIGTRPEEARKMIHQLSDFLRGTLKKEEEQWVSLSEELQYLQLYLDIEKVRFGHRLTTNVDCQEPCTQMVLPSMLLQPIVENAIKFGLYDTTEAVTITIKAEMHDKMLEVTVRNPFDPRTAKPRQGTGFGLSGVQRRLFLLFARNDLLETRPEGEIFTTILKIPQQ